mmetsp:Transcript_11103/g.18146  ORF Transcript_11103/g.18146 Transcript_11103/m.18146 type:complete len:257 (+) Transcript_11103:153-923(+)
MYGFMQPGIFAPSLRAQSMSRHSPLSTSCSRRAGVGLVRKVPLRFHSSQNSEKSSWRQSRRLVVESKLDDGDADRRSLLIVIATAIGASVIGFSAPYVNQLTVSKLAESSTPIEVALGNGRPTVIEFFAEWCEGCKQMVKDVAAIEKTYDGQVNFVMLNVDNSKWIPELNQYDVDGIPHFEFLDSQGRELGRAIGKQPRVILDANLKALLDGQPLPYGDATGETSSLDNTLGRGTSTDPRAHSSVPVKQPPSGSEP